MCGTSVPWPLNTGGRFLHMEHPLPCSVGTHAQTILAQQSHWGVGTDGMLLKSVCISGAGSGGKGEKHCPSIQQQIAKGRVKDQVFRGIYLIHSDIMQ